MNATTHRATMLAAVLARALPGPAPHDIAAFVNALQRQARASKAASEKNLNSCLTERHRKLEAEMTVHLLYRLNGMEAPDGFAIDFVPNQDGWGRLTVPVHGGFVIY